MKPAHRHSTLSISPIFSAPSIATALCTAGGCIHFSSSASSGSSSLHGQNSFQCQRTRCGVLVTCFCRPGANDFPYLSHRQYKGVFASNRTNHLTHFFVLILHRVKKHNSSWTHLPHYKPLRPTHQRTATHSPFQAYRQSWTCSQYPIRLFVMRRRKHLLVEFPPVPSYVTNQTDWRNAE